MQIRIVIRNIWFHRAAVSLHTTLDDWLGHSDFTQVFDPRTAKSQLTG